MIHVGEYWQSYFGVPVFTLGLTHTHTASRSRPQALKYFKEELYLLRTRLGKFAGREIKDSDVRKAVVLCNDVREKLRALYEYPRDYSTPIEWYDVFHIIQAGFLLDKREYLAELKAIGRQLANNPPVNAADNRIRLMIAGSHIGVNDNKLLDIVREAGGNIVVDSVCTGSMLVRKNVVIFGIMGNPMDALAERYLYNIPCPCMTDLSKRLGRLVKLARDYRATALIYYILKDCDSWRAEYQLIKDFLYKEQLVPTLMIESDYSSSDIGAIKTKVEAFLELLGGIT
jgi:benzoyl-CoA reductase/2-hydroxyglutaryl-CoA dehydratase subunit BcrC/BadD/HgdB